MSVVAAGYSYTEGDLAFDPVLELEDVEFKMHAAIVSYMHAFALAGTSARVDIAVPYVHEARWTGQLEGAPASTERAGLADPLIRLSVHLYGGPPLKGQEYLSYRREHPVHTSVGAAIAVTLPVGEYESDKLINLGNNRFSIRPQIGVLHTRGPWSYELTGSAFLYTENDDFFGGSKLEQDPIYALQAHLVRTFKPGWWAACGGAYGWGGRATIDGLKKDNKKIDVLLGASFGMPLTKSQGVKLAYVRTRTMESAGADSDSLILGWSLRF